MPEGLMEQFVRSSHFSGANAVYVEGLYETYLHSPNSIPDEWRKFFDSLPIDQFYYQYLQPLDFL